MLSKEAFLEWFEGQVQGRWPRCVFTEAQLRDWYWRLKTFTPTLLTEATRRHSVCDEPRRPSLKAIHAIARALSSRDGHGHAATGPTPSRGIPDANTYIQCVGTDEQGGGQPGMFVPILIWPFGDHHSPETIERTAWHQATAHQRCYGGLWEPVFDTDQLDMLQRQSRLRQTRQPQK